MSGYEFTNDWFEITGRPIWEKLLPVGTIRRALEIGSYEGASAVWLLEHCPGVQLECVDTWQGSPGEHDDIDMESVYERFQANVMRAAGKSGSKVTWTYGHSAGALSGRWGVYDEAYDFIYIDGSHMAADVISDAVLAWPLVKSGGTLAFDDYFWGPELPAYARAKTGIDAFLDCYHPQFANVWIGPQVIVTKV